MEWNPIRGVQGHLREGARLDVRIQPSGTKGMTFRPRIVEVRPDRALRWLGRLGLHGLFDGEHSFTIEPLGHRRLRFVQREAFRGLLVPLLANSLDRDTKRGFEEMNGALKRRVEQSAP